MRVRYGWKNAVVRLSKCNARKMGPLLIFLFAVHRRMDRNFVRPHVMFEIMNVRSLVGRAESKISGLYRWNSVHKFEPLVFELLGVYIPVLTLLSFPCSFMLVLKPKEWIEH